MAGLGKRFTVGIVGMMLALAVGLPQTAHAAEAPIPVERATPAPVLDTLPAGWMLAGTNAMEYAAGTAKAETLGGLPSGALVSTGFNFLGGGTLSQTIDAAPYRGHRLRFRAAVKTDGVQNGAGLWLQVDGDARMLGKADTHQLPLIGSADWQTREVVIDVPVTAQRLSFGLWLDGRGRAFINGLQLDKVERQEAARQEPVLVFGS